MVDISKLNPEQVSKLAQAILKTTGAVLLDIKKLSPGEKKVPHKLCYRRYDENAGLMEKWGRIVKMIKFVDVPAMDKYIKERLPNHVEVK